MGRTTTQSLDSEHPKRFNSCLGKLIIATNYDAHDSELDLSGRFDRGHKIDGEGGNMWHRYYRLQTLSAFNDMADV